MGEVERMAERPVTLELLREELDQWAERVINLEESLKTHDRTIKTHDTIMRGNMQEVFPRFISIMDDLKRRVETLEKASPSSSASSGGRRRSTRRNRSRKH
jgi:molecular chaperone GrpE (heat shock protein)